MSTLCSHQFAALRCSALSRCSISFFFSALRSALLNWLLSWLDVEAGLPGDIDAFFCPIGWLAPAGGSTRLSTGIAGAAPGRASSGYPLAGVEGRFADRGSTAIQRSSERSTSASASVEPSFAWSALILDFAAAFSFVCRLVPARRSRPSASSRTYRAWRTIDHAKSTCPASSRSPKTTVSVESVSMRITRKNNANAAM